MQAPVAHSYNPSFLGGWDWEDHSSRPTQENSLRDTISKMARAKWTRGVTEAVECLFCKHKTLSSNLSSIKKNKNKIKFSGFQYLKKIHFMQPISGSY
jgi:hypothetical protein